MDFLDPKKQKAHHIRLSIGYALLGIALLLGTVVLLYQAYGYSIDRNGRVIQNGFVFMSSLPGGADIYVNGVRKDVTNTRLQLPAGGYAIELRQDGYRTWKRAITVDGGVVERFDYPFLFPTKLVTTTAKQYAAAPTLVTQSPDRRWLLVQSTPQDQFDLYDLNAVKPVPKPLVLPADALTTGTTTDWKAVEWAADNRHLVLRRAYQKDGQPAQQYVLMDRQDPTLSQNLSVTFGFTPATVSLREQKYDQYYLYDQPAGQLLTATLKKPTPQPYLSHVLAFATSQDRLLYVTSQDAANGVVNVRLRIGDRTFTLRQLPAQSAYLLKVAAYNGDWLVAAGAQTEGKIYIYQNPDTALSDNPQAVLVPLHILKTALPTDLSVSLNNRFLVSENADRFAVYDAETNKGYAYQVSTPLAAPQTHAAWMDGYHLDMVSGGKLTVFDFDGANLQTLVAADPAYPMLFSRDYQTLYAFNSQHALTATSLLVK